MDIQAGIQCYVDRQFQRIHSCSDPSRGDCSMHFQSGRGRRGPKLRASPKQEVAHSAEISTASTTNITVQLQQFVAWESVQRTRKSICRQHRHKKQGSPVPSSLRSHSLTSLGITSWRKNPRTTFLSHPRSRRKGKRMISVAGNRTPALPALLKCSNSR